jgi:hypothetical protein
MDHEHRTNAAYEQNPATAARIVRSIAEIERDYHLLIGPLGERLMWDVFTVMGDAAPSPWIVAETDASVSLLSPDWKLKKGLGNGDAWLEIGEIDDDELEYSWVAAAVDTCPNKMCLELIFRRGLIPAAEAAIGDNGTVSDLLKLGFMRDEAKERLFLPITVPAEALAIGFEQNDLTEALTPVRIATELAITAKPELDKLIEKVRGGGKK